MPGNPDPDKKRLAAEEEKAKKEKKDKEAKEKKGGK